MRLHTGIGIDAGHIDLDGGKVIAWKDWVNNRTAPYDDHGHGTHVAGIVAGTGEGNTAMRGVAPGAALVGLKVLNSAGSGSLSDVAAAVDWAVTNRDTYNIKVISMCFAQVLLSRPPAVTFQCNYSTVREVMHRSRRMIHGQPKAPHSD